MCIRDRDEASERAIKDRAAAAAAMSDARSAAERAAIAEAETARLRQRVDEAAERLLEHERDAERVRDVLDSQASAAEEAAAAMSAETAAAVADAAAARREAATEAARFHETAALLEDARAHGASVAEAAEQQLGVLREEMDVLRARLTARDARAAVCEEQEAEIARLKENLAEAVGGVDGAVATALRRARAQLRNALSDAPGMGSIDGDDDVVAVYASHSRGIAPVSYTHLTLPTILLV